MTSQAVNTLDPAIELRGRRGQGLPRRLALNLGPPLVLFGVFVGLAYFVSYLLLSPGRRWLFPPPHEIVKNGFLNGRNLHEQLTALWDTAQVSIVGLLIAFAIGATVALVMSQAKWIERSLYPYAVLVQVTPGLGRLLDVYRAYLETDLMMSALLFCVALGLASFLVVGIVGRQLTKNWYEEGNR